MKKIYSVISFLCLAFIWAGCGSGGGGGGGGATTASTPPAPAPAPTLTESASGIWTGTIVSNGTGPQCNQQYPNCMVGIVDENNVLRFLNVITGDQYSGTVYGSGNTISTTITIYPVGPNSIIAAVQITGTVDDAANPKTMTLQYSVAGDTGSINLLYDPALYERQSSISNLICTWTLMNSTDTVTIADNGNNSGTLNGVLTLDPTNALYTSCPLTGSVTIINSAYNAYAVDISISNCDVFNGSYQGLASLRDVVQGSNDNKEFTFYISRSDAAIVAQFTR